MTTPLNDAPPQRVIPSSRPDRLSRDRRATPLGVLNPFAIAELVIGVRIPWSRIDAPHLLLQAVFGTPYHQMFSPHKTSSEHPSAHPSTSGSLLHARSRQEAYQIVLEQLRHMGHPNPTELIPPAEHPHVPSEHLTPPERQRQHDEVPDVSDDPGQAPPVDGPSQIGLPRHAAAQPGLAAQLGAPRRAPLSPQDVPLAFTYRSRNLTWTHDPVRLLQVLNQGLPSLPRVPHAPIDEPPISDEPPARNDTPTTDDSPSGGETLMELDGVLDPTHTTDDEPPAPPYQPPQMEWVDPGDFFSTQGTGGLASLSDPVQGNVGNCYLIATLSAVAFTSPDTIKHQPDPAAPTDQDTALISFWNPDAAGNPTLPHPITVTEAIQVWASSGMVVYARSSQPGETWPGVYEKAFAAYLTGDSDRPDIIATAYGEPALTLRRITGHNTTTWALDELLPAEIMTIIKDHCDGGKKLTHPAVTWTWPSSSVATQQTGKPVSYVDYNLVAGHAYTLLGWEDLDGHDVILLRNPFGKRDLKSITVSTATPALEKDTWVPYAQDEGVFAISLKHFHSHFKKLAIAD